VHTPNTRNFLVFANILAKKFLPQSAIVKLVYDRAEEDVYPTYYRANNTRVLRNLGESVNLRPEFVRILTHPQPYTRFFAPAAFLELLLMRTTMTHLFERFGTTIVMVFRKQPIESVRITASEQISESLQNLTRIASSPG
jgi:hypothetical protein